MRILLCIVTFCLLAAPAAGASRNLVLSSAQHNALIAYKLYQKGELARAHQYVQAALQDAPSDPFSLRLEQLIMAKLQRVEENAFIDEINCLIAWKSFEQAQALIESALCYDPNNLEYRRLYAHILAYQGFNDRALRACYSILRDHPCDRRTRELVANLYAWTGNPVASVNLFRLLLSEEGTEGARLGLAYAFLSLKNRSGAAALARGLCNPALNYEINRDRFLDLRYPRISGGHRFLHGDGDFSINDTFLTYSWQCCNATFTVDVDRLHVDRNFSSEEEEFELDLPPQEVRRLRIGAVLPLSLRWTVFGGIGFAEYTNKGLDPFDEFLSFTSPKAFPIGNVGFLVRLPWSEFSVDAKYQIYDLSLDGLASRVRSWNVRTNFLFFLSDRQTIGAHTLWKKWNTGNHFNDYTLFYDFLLRRVVRSERYYLPLNPQINVIYQIKYQNTHRPFVIVGVWDPIKFLSNQVRFNFLVYNKRFQPLFQIAPILFYYRWQTLISQPRGFFAGVEANLYQLLKPNLMFTAEFKKGRYLASPELFEAASYEILGRLIFDF